MGGQGWGVVPALNFYWLLKMHLSKRQVRYTEHFVIDLPILRKIQTNKKNKTSASLSLKHSWWFMNTPLFFESISCPQAFSCSRFISWCRLQSEQFCFFFSPLINPQNDEVRTSSTRTPSKERVCDTRSDYPRQVARRVEPAEAKYFTYPPSVICAPFVPQILIRCSPHLMFICGRSNK